jgi:hypothetical protein
VNHSSQKDATGPTQSMRVLCHQKSRRQRFVFIANSILLSL